MIWFTADPHFGHQKIIKYCDRPFETYQEMDEVLIENWNSLVKSRDIVYVLGDFSMMSKPKLLNQWFQRLKGKKILIVGNHDSNACKKLSWTAVYDVRMLKHDGHKLWLSHYPHRSWPDSATGSMHLFGHVHGRLPRHKRSMDVGVDVHDFKPVSFDQVLAELGNKGIAL